MSAALMMVGVQINAVGRWWCCACQPLNGCKPCSTKRCKAYSIAVQLNRPTKVKPAIDTRCPGGPSNSKKAANIATEAPYRAKSARYTSLLCSNLNRPMQLLGSTLRPSPERAGESTWAQGTRFARSVPHRTWCTTLRRRAPHWQQPAAFLGTRCRRCAVADGPWAASGPDWGIDHGAQPHLQSLAPNGVAFREKLRRGNERSQQQEAAEDEEQCAHGET